ncbi:MAG TPA: FAD-binding oxidoreductase, partial [Syntrophomonas sp.]|nr:FAD-binding oxidoreductase [Syntrophomonas sp.]
MSNLEAMAKGKILSDICPVQSAEELNGYQLDGLSPEYVVKPKNAAEAAQVLALAASSKTPAAVTGNGTKFVYGSPLQKLAWVINTAEMVSEPEIKADDLMVFAQAGLPLSVLQDQLKQKNLFLPVDIGTNGATVGGLLAHGGGSSHRLAYGLIRDMVLGLTVALTDGKLYKFGGQTVKNVTGY